MPIHRIRGRSLTRVKGIVWHAGEMNETAKETTKGILFGAGLVILACGTIVGLGYAIRPLFVMLRHQGIL